MHLIFFPNEIRSRSVMYSFIIAFDTSFLFCFFLFCSTISFASNLFFNMLLPLHIFLCQNNNNKIYFIRRCHLWFIFIFYFFSNFSKIFTLRLNYLAIKMLRSDYELLSEWAYRCMVYSVELLQIETLKSNNCAIIALNWTTNDQRNNKRLNYDRKVFFSFKGAIIKWHHIFLLLLLLFVQ